jgi:predicted ATPase
MIEALNFRNFKVLRDARLPLGRFTLLVGPNGSGKTSAIQGLQLVAGQLDLDRSRAASAGTSRSERPQEETPDSAHAVNVTVHWAASSRYAGYKTTWYALSNGSRGRFHETSAGEGVSRHEALEKWLAKVRVFALDALAIATPVTVVPEVELAPNGAQLAAVLDRLRDRAPERFKALNEELARWLPDFDQILFDTTSPGMKAFSLRLRAGQHTIGADQLSQGTLFALAILTLAHLPEPPSMACLEEPDRGVHPRLLRRIQDALYRLSYPENFSESRDPVQVVATTHSPYFLDLFRDHPEEVVIAEKDRNGAHFEPLAGRSDIREILGDVELGDAWYTGVLGGVPAEE